MRIMFLLFLLASIASFTGIVKCKASEISTSQSRGEESRGLSSEEFISKILKEGFDHTVSEVTATNLGFEHSLQTKVIQVTAENAADKKVREAYIVLDSSSNEGESKAAAIIFLSKKKSKSGAETHYFRLSLNCDLERAALSKLKYDDEGNVVPGSGNWSSLATDKKDVKAAVSYELDFWLKDKHRARGK